MNNMKRFLTAAAFAFAGVAVHANAASENHRGDTGICFQLTPLAGKGEVPSLSENGASRTPQGQQLERLAEGGFERTPQGMQGERLASNGFGRTPLGRWLEEKTSVYPV